MVRKRKGFARNQPRHSCRINDDDITRGRQHFVSVWQLPAGLAVVLDHRVSGGTFHGSMIPDPPPADVCYDAIFHAMDLKETLQERGQRYGRFVDHAAVTQELKQVAARHLGRRLPLAPDQQEALDMIFHKIGRIVCGDPDYADSWHDIAGYAKLVEDRLNGISQ